MAGDSYLLDTVIVAAYFNRDPVVLHHFRDSIILVSSVVIGELFFGAYHSGHVGKNVSQIRDFVARNTILVCGETTGDYYGQIKQQLRAKGRPIPDNDIWIAATAMQHGLSLVTRDRHFREIDGLTLATW